MLISGGAPMLEWSEFTSKYLIGRDPLFTKEIDKIPIIAKCDSSVLVYGQTGTGKEVCVRATHLLSNRASKPFVAINCGAVPPDLVENELFGHKHGAFTGASKEKAGLIQEAEGGSLFLDEIDNLPQIAQVKLLRFLQEKTYRPLGSTRECRADVRVIAAMNIDPVESVKLGRLREDLFYRLNVISIELPPLRARREDIPLLANHFLKKHAAAHRKQISFSPEALNALKLYEWPGNVRELEHVIERAVIFAQDNTIRELPQLGLTAEKTSVSFKEAKQKVVQEFEKQYISDLLAACNGNISKAALAAKKHRRAFVHLIRKYGIESNSFKNDLQAS
jgi:transcriptional regulator with PAS, ATPase and Fis domain